MNKQYWLALRSTPGMVVLLALLAMVEMPFGMNRACAQTAEWKMILNGTSADSPMGAIYGACYDSKRGVVMLHGGSTPDGGFNPFTWEYDGFSWKKVSSNGPVRYSAGMTYDPNRGVTVLYGGNNIPGRGFDERTYSSTWEWDGSAWKEMTEVDNTPRTGVPLVYDPVQKVVIRHGGGGPDSIPAYNDTWKWDGKTWERLADGPLRVGHRLAYDSRLNKIVLFGGIDRYGSAPGDTWEYDGARWVKISDSGPQGREMPGMVFDESRGVSVMFGGMLITVHGFNSWQILSDTWEWNGTEWTQTSKQGPSTFAPDLAYDSRRKTIVLYRPTSSGSDILLDTWEYKGQSGLANGLWSLH